MKTRMVFMGSDTIALPALDSLVSEASDRLDVAAIFTQPDRPSGRGKKLRPNGIKEWALVRRIPVHQPERLGAGEVDLLKESGCEIILVMAYGHILRKVLLALPRLGTYNLHASLLPKYRGASPIQAALASGERHTGVTLMRMVRRLDAGPIIDQEAFPIESLETGASAEEKIASACVPLLRRNLAGLLGGNAAETDQEEEDATYCRKLAKDDGRLDFSAPAQLLARRINALFPWPGSYFDLGGQRIKIGLADFSPVTAAESPGTIVSRNEKEVRIATGDGELLLLRLQRPGGRMLEAADFLRGFPMLHGLVLPSEPMSELVAKEPFPPATGRGEGSG